MNFMTYVRMEDVGVCFYERCNNASLVDTPASFNCSAFSLLKPRFYAVCCRDMEFGIVVWPFFRCCDFISGFSGGRGL